MKYTFVILFSLCVYGLITIYFSDKFVSQEKSSILLCEKEYNNCKNYQSSSDDCEWKKIWWCIHR